MPGCYDSFEGFVHVEVILFAGGENLTNILLQNPTTLPVQQFPLFFVAFHCQNHIPLFPQLLHEMRHDAGAGVHEQGTAFPGPHFVVEAIFEQLEGTGESHGQGLREDFVLTRGSSKCHVHDLQDASDAARTETKPAFRETDAFKIVAQRLFFSQQWRLDVRAN